MTRLDEHPGGHLAPGSQAASSLAVPSSGERHLVAERYEILALLGAGATGTVYRARDVELDEIVALKVLRRELCDTPESLEHFRREVKLSRRVTHHNVARVFDIGEHEGERLLTMELIEGEPLSAALAREGAFPVPRAVAVALAVAEGLGAAHAAGVVHRDLKPDNVLLSRDGRVVVTDFGVARAFAGVGGAGGAGSSFGGIVGTPAYMAPEQIEGRADVDARADVYAFGALLHELCTGRRAWPGASPFVPARLSGAAPDPREHQPDLPPALAALVMRCLARRREDRPASMAEVGAELFALGPSEPLEPPPPSLAPPEPALPAESDKTIAVLPFRNAGAPEDAYLAAELTDDLIDALSMTPGLRVRARSTLPAGVGADADAREIGRAIGVEAVVEGSVRRARGGVRMTARLVGVADGFQLWAKRWDRSAEEVLAINDEAARAIAAALGVAAREAARVAPRSAETIDLYLRARHEYRKFWPDALRRSAALFEQALAESPDDPLLLSGLAVAEARLAFFEGAGLPGARVAAERAVLAAPTSGEPHLALGSVLFQLGDTVGAVRALRAAVTHAPGLAEGQAALGRIFGEIGAVPDALRRLEAALLLDPDVPLARPEISRILALLGRWEQSEVHTELLRTQDHGMRYWIQRSRLELWRRRRCDDEAYGRMLAEAEGPLVVAPRLIHALHLHGRLPEGAPDLEVIAANLPGHRGQLFLLQMAAEIHAFVGDRDRAVSAIVAAAAAGLIDRLWIDRCPLLDEVREDPRLGPARADVERRTDAVLAAYHA